MRSLLDATINLLTLRDGPQALPHSPVLLTRLLLLLLPATALFMTLLYSGPQIAVHTLASLALTFGLPCAVLSATGKQARIVQTATAICLVELVFIAVDFALFLAYGTPPDKAEHATPIQGVIVLLLLAFQIGQVAINAGIYRHALDWNPAAALGLSVTFAAIAISVSLLLQPVAQAAPP